jgi:hypothetical protein
VLILAPLSVVRDAWMHTLLSCVPYRFAVEATGATKNTTAAFARASDKKRAIVVANYDKVKFNYKDVMEFAPQLIICDEASVFRSDDSDVYKAFSSVINNLKPRLWALTASPAGNANPVGVWPMARCVNPRSVPYSLYKWRYKVQYKITHEEGVIWKNKDDWEDTVAEALRPAVRFRTQDCIDMPPVVMVERYAPMSTKQQKAFKQMKAKSAASLREDGGQVVAANAAVKTLKLLQITAGIVYDDGELIEVGATGKMRELLAIIAESSSKVIVFTPFLSVMRYVVDKLNKKKIKAVGLRSGDSLNRRQQAFNEFQDKNSDLRVLVTYPTIAKFGITLTAADTTVWWGPIYDGEAFDQANMRMQGPKTHKCAVVMLYSNNLERDLYGSLQDKTDTSHRIVDIFKREVVKNGRPRRNRRST